MPVTRLPRAVETRLSALPTGLREHTECVRRIARDLAQGHGADAGRVDLAAACHDLARAVEDDRLLEQAKRYRLRVDPVERSKPLLLHGPVARLWLEREAGVEDKEVLDAVRWHTTGHRRMGPVAKVVFLADKLDPSKIGRYPYLEKIAALARKSLDDALLAFLDRELADFLRLGHLIHPSSVELRNELMTAPRRIH